MSSIIGEITNLFEVIHKNLDPEKKDKRIRMRRARRQLRRQLRDERRGYKRRMIQIDRFDDWLEAKGVKEETSEVIINLLEEYHKERGYSTKKTQTPQT